MTGYGQMSSGVRAINKAKQIKNSDLIDDEKAVQWQREYNDLLVKKRKLETEGQSAGEDYAKLEAEITEKEKQRIYTTREVN
jgi:hypothetical protein